jgi:hypothetical protein
MSWTNEQILAAWKNASAPPAGYDSSKYRLDSCGALIYWSSYGKTTDFGWQVDHVFPASKGGKEEHVNLRAMQYQNNGAKANNYPGYSCAVTFNGRTNSGIGATGRTVHQNTRNKLANLYGKKAS